MRVTGKLAAFAMATSMALVLGACSTSSTTTTSVSTSNGETTTTTTSTSTSSVGTDSNSSPDTYTNDELKYGYTLPPDLNVRFAEAEELNQMNGFELKGENIIQHLDEGEPVVFALVTSEGDSARMSAVKLAGTSNQGAVPADLVSKFADQYAANIPGAAMQDTQAGTYTLEGVDYPYVSFTLDVNGTRHYCAVAGIVSGDYFVYFTVDTLEQPHVERLLSGIQK